MVAANGFAATDVGYLLIDLGTGDRQDGYGAGTIKEWQADHGFVPGSVLKLATSLTAWHVLGADFRFATRLWQKGDDLYLQGGGDPVLAATDLKDLMRVLQGTQPGKAWRHFYVDARAVLPASEISDRQPAAADYNPGYGALNVNFNRLAISRGSGPAAGWQIRSLADGLTVPVDWVPLEAAPGTLPAGAPFIMAGNGETPPTDHWWVDRKLLQPGAAVPDLFLPVKQPDRMTAQIFRVIADRLGLALPEAQDGEVPAAASLLAQHESPALPDLLQGLLRYSNNLSAELIGLTTAGKITGKAVTLETAAAVEMHWLAEHLPAMSWRGFQMANFSGLDGANRASPRQMMAILQAIVAEPALAASLPDLAVSMDEAGALAAAGWHVTGKSGTMDYAAGLAGIIAGPAGRRYGYVIFLTDERRRAALAASFDPRVLHPAQDGRAWTLHARQMEMALVKNWLSELAH